MHTVARFREGFGDYTDPATGRLIVGNVPESGLWWDQDLRFEEHVRAGKYPFLTVLVNDPIIYRAGGRCAGYTFCGDNCVHYARDAWHFYSGEWYDLPALALPLHLVRQVRCSHPHISLGKRFGWSLDSD